MKSENFYQYIQTETFLIFQTDTLIIEKYKETINEFLEYDYVGAPWSETYLPEFGIHEYNAIGNGGLSLRKKSKMLEILEKNKDTELFKKMNEDTCFSFQKNVEMKKPDFEKAKLLSKSFNNFPFYFTRDLDTAKSWLRSKSNDNSDRAGLVASSKSKRLLV